MTRLLPLNKCQADAQQDLQNGAGGRREKNKSGGGGVGLTLTTIPSPLEQSPFMYVCNFLCLNWSLANSIGFGIWARNVIPFSLKVASSTIPTILPVSTWFAVVPPLIISLRRVVIKRIKFVIGFPIQSNPPMAGSFSIPQQVVNKLVFILWFNHGKVCSHILAKSPWIVPCWRWRCTINVIARFSVCRSLRELFLVAVTVLDHCI